MQQRANNKFDKQVKKLLENAEVEAPAFLWNAIESKLPVQKPWYSKYKYIILLLLLVSSSATSIFIYKNSQQHFGNNKNLATVNKQEQNVKSTSAATKIGNTFENKSSNAASSNMLNTDALTSKPSVSNFYETSEGNKDNRLANIKQQQDKATAERTMRLKRFEVLQANKINDDKQNINTIQNTNVSNVSNSINQIQTPQNDIVIASATTLAKTTQTISDEQKILANTNQEMHDVNATNEKIQEANIASTHSNDNATEALIDDDSQNVFAVKNDSEKNANKLDYVDYATTTTNNENSDFLNFDATSKIVSPLNSSNAADLTASVIPVKINHTPIPSRDVMRSLVAPEILEKFDFETQAAGINDLNPNREKILKNLKQFAGYNINRGFHIGAFIGINSVWLNKKQFSTDENTTAIKPKFQLGKAYGINIGYDYSDRWGITMEWQIAEQGQKYSMQQIGEDHRCVKEVNLLYTKFPILMKYKQMFINHYNSKPIALSFLFGPQVSLLLKKEILMDGNKIQSNAKYNKFEFGLIGGFDFDLFMTRNLSLTIGGRTGFGTSMQKGKPMSFQLGVMTQLNFRLPKKIK